jgi:hypothetical protein
MLLPMLCCIIDLLLAEADLLEIQSQYSLQTWRPNAPSVFAAGHLLFSPCPFLKTR